jgi:hypothetical protein
MVRRRDEQPPSRREHPPDLGQPTGGVCDVLDHFARPHHLERAILERKRSVDRGESEIELGMSGARTSQGRLGDLDTDGPAPGALQLGGEAPVAGAKVEDPLAGRYMVQ